jgi:hypothetical protein
MASDGHSTDGTEYDYFSPCPGCGTIGFTVQVWVEGTQMMQCDENDCRVQKYEPQSVNTGKDCEEGSR